MIDDTMPPKLQRVRDATMRLHDAAKRLAKAKRKLASAQALGRLLERIKPSPAKS